MLEPLSETRRDLLLSLNLCTAADLRRARRHVRRLARNLPAFDSVWLDALVRMGKITPFQARILESGHPEQIRIGPCLLIERLGGGPLGETFLVSTGRGHKPCAIKRLSAVERLSAEAEERLTTLIERLCDLAHPAIAAPFRCERVGEELVVVSRHVAGLHLGELLVRRGRFPPAVVWEIARQLADGMHALELRGVAHGDIRASNVRLTKAGAVVLVDTGIRAAVDPELSVHSGLPPDRYDGVAPERIGTVVSPTVKSDMYAFGCLLWQLLAGRPPFPGGDPLVKLAAHQTRSIDDVRNWAPTTPPPLAEGIRWLTSRNPADRPEGFAEVLHRWGVPTWHGRRRLAGFRRWFDAPAPMRVEPASRARGPRWRVLACLLVAALLAAGALQHEGARTVLVSWRAQLTPADPELTENDADVQSSRQDPPKIPGPAVISVDSDDDLASLPVPDQHGVVRLGSTGRYRARRIATVGALTIIGEGPTPSEIVVRAESFELTAETVRIEHVHLRHEATASVRGGSRPPLMRVQSQTLHLDRCVLLVSELPVAPPVKPIDGPLSPTTGLSWKLVDPRDPRGGIAVFRNSLLVGGDCAIEMADPVRRIEFSNCLRLAGGALGQLVVAPGARHETLVRLDRTTCRGATALFRLAHSEGPPPLGRMSIEANDCVLDLLAPDGCLFELPAEFDLESTRKIKLTGEGSLAPATLASVVRKRPPDEPRTPDEPPDVPVEGILAGPYRFAGGFSLRPSDAMIRDYDAPRRSTVSPGIDAANLPSVAP